MLNVELIPISLLKPNRRNARTHSAKQIRQIANSIAAFGFLVPVLIDDDQTIVAGHGRWAAAKLLQLPEIPVLKVTGLSAPQKRALALADNKIAENAGWDRQILAAELPELAELLIQGDLDISITGFSSVEIDQIVVDLEDDSSDPADEFEQNWFSLPPVSRPGDLWQLGNHRILCGDAREPDILKHLIGDNRAAMAFLDPPYNLWIEGIGGRGRIKHAQFAMASDELSRSEFVAVLTKVLSAAASVSLNGATHYVCVDWRHLGELWEAGRIVYRAALDLAVWVKSTAGPDSFYRSQHELVGVFRVGNEQHNNVELGRRGRHRSNVWHYPGVNRLRADRIDGFVSHPPVKPVALVCGAIKDSTRRGEIVLDTFAGSGTTILAAEHVGRRAFALEIEPRFVDVAIRRWQQFTRKDAVQTRSGHCFDELILNGQPQINATSSVERGHT